VGGGHGSGHEGGGDRETEFGWYHAMLRDRFHARWDQPVSILQQGQEYVTLVELQINRSGEVVSASISRSSGNTTMDDSVMAAARRVTRVEPLPEGLGSSSGYKVNIEFKLNRN